MVIHVSRQDGFNARWSGKIRECTGKVVRDIILGNKVDDLLIEGGATTSEIFRYLGIKKLYPFSELESGVIQMRTDRYPGLRITTKPGSYHWPDCLITENNKKRHDRHFLTNQS